MSVTSEVEELRQRVAVAQKGGSESARQKHIDQGKLMVRDRLRLLFDQDASFEDGLLAGAQRGLAADGVVTCIGKVHGRDVAVIANDMTVKAGTWGQQALLKMIRMQEVAGEARIPLIYLVDSAGARIDEQKECFLGRRAWGNIFHNQIQLSGVVPQLCVLFGPSPAGAAYVPALCDNTFMVDKKASAYLGSPRMAKMAIGEDVTDEQMGGARLHCAVSGVGDMLVVDDAEAIAKTREYLRFFPSHWSEKPPTWPSAAPRPGRPLEEVVPVGQNVPFDVHQFIEGLVDAESFFEIKAMFAKEITTGLARLGGAPVGIIANNSAVKGGALFNDSSDKAARFIWLCNAFNIPLLFLQDISGYMIGSAVEKAGIIRHGAKLLSAVCESTVPRICVLVRKAYGGGYLAMSGAPTNPDAMLALPTAMPALVGPEAAVNAIYFNQIMAIEDEKERIAFVKQKRDEYAKDIDVYATAADAFAVEAVVESSCLRDELIHRYRIYSRRTARVIERRNPVHPV